MRRFLRLWRENTRAAIEKDEAVRVLSGKVLKALDKCVQEPCETVRFKHGGYEFVIFCVVDESQLPGA